LLILLFFYLIDYTMSKKGKAAAKALQEEEEEVTRRSSGRRRRQELPGLDDGDDDNESPTKGNQKKAQGKKKSQPQQQKKDTNDKQDNDKGKEKAVQPKQRQQVEQKVVNKTGMMKTVMAEAQSKGEGGEFVIKLEEFSLSFGSLLLLENTSLTLAFGHRYGLIGPNGTGKSTLLRNIAQRTLKGIPKNIQILYVEQEVDGTDKTPLESVIEADEERLKLLREQQELEAAQKEDERRLEAGEEVDYNEERETRLREVHKKLAEIGAHSAVARASAILTGLQFTEDMIRGPTRQLSGGWRMRIALARALFCRPHLLLLDEPTNHLDLHACVWLDDFLSKWKKTLLLVSHDVDLLNNVCTDIICLKGQKLHQYKGNYESYERVADEQHRQHVKAYEKQQKQIKQLKILKGKAVKADGAAKAKAKGKAGGGGGNRREGKDQAAIQAKKRAQELEEMELIPKPPKDYRVRFIFEEADSLPHPVLQVKEVGFRYPPRDGVAEENPWIFQNLNLGIDLDTRIALVGRNGAGKSTLLNLLTGDLEPTTGQIIRSRKLRIARFTQHFVDQLPTDVTPVEYLVSKFPDMTPQDARNHLGKFGLLGKVHLHKLETLSGGQKSRVVLATLSMSKPHILFLDEPTNHLDITSIQALAEGLANFNGGVVMVTHDQYLISAACNRIWCVEGSGKVYEFPGDFRDYQAKLLEELNVYNEEDA